MVISSRKDVYHTSLQVFNPKADLDASPSGTLSGIKDQLEDQELHRVLKGPDRTEEIGLGICKNLGSETVVEKSIPRFQWISRISLPPLGQEL